ncbi:uncharacterized protein C2845_PM12G30680 [Panicum miliaceum]|uniref:Uncharacterized protein n=1 Tax=Panicum miliaceum TaxID=4540 RepID=A0A3L6QHU1_PANMI|nr:uncharacterized protein C2845_PM12G30680 [Panicum miliaceum]
MEEVLGLVRGFVDVLVLAGGRTSSGAAATSSSDEVNKALRWALFFEEVFKDLRESGHYEDSAGELDPALVELTSSPEFPKVPVQNCTGLAGMRSKTLSTARVLVIRHFLKARAMCVENLGALLEAVVEMDIDVICASGVRNACQETSRMVDEFLMWKQWRAKCLAYLLDDRTIRIMSGASLIFKAPKEQWMKVFEPLKSFEESSKNGLVEIMELCFLGLISREWNPMIEGFMTHTFCLVPISKQYADLHQLLQGTSQDKCQDKLLDLQEEDILEYASQSLRSKPSILWLLPPVLTAAAVPPRSTMFQIYLAQIDRQFHEAAPADRKCCCRGDGIEQHHNYLGIEGVLAPLFRFQYDE